MIDDAGMPLRSVDVCRSLGIGIGIGIGIGAGHGETEAMRGKLRHHLAEHAPAGNAISRPRLINSSTHGRANQAPSSPSRYRFTHVS